MDFISIAKAVGKLVSLLVAGALGVRILLYLYILVMSFLPLPENSEFDGKVDMVAELKIRHYIFFGVFAMFLALGIYL